MFSFQFASKLIQEISKKYFSNRVEAQDSDSDCGVEYTKQDHQKYFHKAMLFSQTKALPNKATSINRTRDKDYFTRR